MDNLLLLHYQGQTRSNTVDRVRPWHYIPEASLLDSRSYFKMFVKKAYKENEL